MSSAGVSKSLSAYSCVRCFERKVKCSRELPFCTACDKHGQSCEYRAPAKPQRRKRRAQEDGLIHQLKQYKQLLQQHGIIQGTTVGPDPHEDVNGHELASGSVTWEKVVTPSTVASTDNQRQFARSQLIFNQGRSQYLENNLWTRVTEELSAQDEAFSDSDEDSTMEDTPGNNTDYVLLRTPSSVVARMSHPLPEQVMTLWQTFLENVNPLSKLIHYPTLQVSIQKASTHLDRLPKNLEALLFAIYSGAVLSLTNRDCERHYGEKRVILLSRYRNATKIALSRAKFMGSADIVVFQAFMLHLLTTRDEYDSKTLWTLTGVATRIAEGMGLHRDGSTLGLPIFETEIRRRIWWQLKLLDYRSAELSGSNKFKDSGTIHAETQLPSNINDDDIYPGMTGPVKSRDGVSEMMFCCLRYETGSFWSNKIGEEKRQGNGSANLFDNYESTDVIAKKDRDCDELQAILEIKYVRYCDPTVPLQLLCSLLARGSVTSMRLVARHPRRYAQDSDVPQAEREILWTLSLKQIEGYLMATTDRKLKRFAWHGKFYFQWQAFIYVLDCLLAQPSLSGADKAWADIDEVFDEEPDFIANTKKPIHVAVGTLCVKAYNAREQYLARQGQRLPVAPPEYIVRLRQQRDAAKAKRQQQQTKSELNQRDAVAHVHRPVLQENHQHLQPGRDEDTSNSGFWYDDLGFQQPNSIDMDFMLAQDPFAEESSMDWAQWDHLLQNPGAA